MLNNNKGVAEIAILTYVIVGLALLFVPNPISTAVGIGNKPNKTVQTEKIELLTDKKGNPVLSDEGAYITRHTYSDVETREKTTFLEWLMSLPIFVLFLMFMGVIFPPVSFILARLRNIWKTAFKNQYHGLKDLKDVTVICRKCGDAVTIDTKEHVFDDIEKKLDNRDKVLQEVIRTELTK